MGPPREDAVKIAKLVGQKYFIQILCHTFILYLKKITGNVCNIQILTSTHFQSKLKTEIIFCAGMFSC